MKALPVRSLQVTTLANIVAVYYGCAGAITTIVYMVQQQDKFSAPLGLLLPFINLKISLTYDPPSSLFQYAFLLSVFSVSYAFTGWLSGSTIGLLYNLLAKYFGIQVKGNFEPPLVTKVNSQATTACKN